VQTGNGIEAIKFSYTYFLFVSICKCLWLPSSDALKNWNNLAFSGKIAAGIAHERHHKVL
jgi:hypothetical protein